MLFAAPPFDRPARDPGYLEGHPPGVHENGGAYMLAAIWVAWVCAELRWGDCAHALFTILNLILRSDTPAKAAR